MKNTRSRRPKCRPLARMRRLITALLALGVWAVHGVVAVPARAEEVVKIAVVFAHSGKGADFGRVAAQTARYAVQKINRQGGVLGRKVALIEYDNASTVLGTRRAAEKASAAGVAAVIGSSWSSHSQVMAAIMQASKIPMITPVSTNPEITRTGDYIFRVCFEDSVQGDVLARFAFSDLKARRVVVLTNVDALYSTGLSRRFISVFQGLGGSILREEDYLGDAERFIPALERIKALNPDLIFLPGYLQDSCRIITQARDLGLTAPFLGADAWGDTMYALCGAKLRGNYYSTHWHKGCQDPLSRAFVTDYTNQYGPINHNNLVLVYDACMVLADAIRRADSLDRAKIRDALAATSNFRGISGPIAFDAERNPIAKPVVIMRFDGRTAVYVKTIGR